MQFKKWKMGVCASTRPEETPAARGPMAQIDGSILDCGFASWGCGFWPSVSDLHFWERPCPRVGGAQLKLTWAQPGS